MDDRERGRKGAGRHHLIGESGIDDDREGGKGRSDRERWRKGLREQERKGGNDRDRRTGRYRVI